MVVRIVYDSRPDNGVIVLIINNAAPFSCRSRGVQARHVDGRVPAALTMLLHPLPRDTMIRSNPTAIPLRADDIKHLQAAIKDRKDKEARGNGATMVADPANTQSASSARPADTQPYNAAEQRKKDKAAMSVNDRIGL